MSPITPMNFHPKERFSRLVFLLFILVTFSSCATQPAAHAASPSPHMETTTKHPHLADKHYVSFDGDTFGYTKWLPLKKKPSIVIVGVHGISGHAEDYDNLGKHFQQHHQDVALYAAETRGQGMDPKKYRRGDIRSSKEWLLDLYTFTSLVKKKHPEAKVIWIGESMGSLIVMNAYSNKTLKHKLPDAVVILSPIVGVNNKLPRWKYIIARSAAFLLPKLKVSLESLSNGQKATVTKEDIHEQQAAKNPWYIRQYTLRLLVTLSDLSNQMSKCASQIKCPVLIVHGGKDIFTSEKSIAEFSTHFPKNKYTARKFYPGSFHLLMYDHDRKKIFKDISTWLKSLSR